MLPNTTGETPNQAADDSGRRTRRISIRSEETGVAVALVALVAVIGVFHPDFLAFSSIIAVLRDTAFIGLMAFGMVYLLCMQELDMSVAASTGCPRWCARCCSAPRSTPAVTVAAGLGARSRPQAATDIAEVVAFLASNKARNITGSAFNVSGGMEMR